MNRAAGSHRIDVEYLGRAGGILANVLETPAGLVVIDPGPARSLDGLLRGMTAAGLDPAELHAILLTHIHLDHAGATGTLVEQNAGLRVFVHERGAPHLTDPSRLLASALRIYGDALDRLFGAVQPVPAANVTVLGDADRLDFGGRIVHAAYAPGHAWHHVAYLDEQTGSAYVGDTLGERFAPETYVLPVTPPPDIDLEAWRDTLAKLRAWQPAELVLTHFGGYTDVTAHLDQFERRLEDWAARVRASLAAGGDDESLAQAFEAEVLAELETAVGPEAREKYHEGGICDSWYGLARYWRRRA